MATYSVRRAVPEDSDTLARFMTLQAVETEGKTLVPETIAQGVRGLFERPACGTYYVAVDSSDSIVGMIMIHYEMSLRGLVHWINSVYVDPAYRKQGVFTLLYKHVLAEARDATCLRLYVDLGNTSAQQVYRKLGMANIEDDYDFYESDFHFPF